MVSRGARQPSPPRPARPPQPGGSGAGWASALTCPSSPSSTRRQLSTAQARAPHSHLPTHPTHSCFRSAPASLPPPLLPSQLLTPARSRQLQHPRPGHLGRLHRRLSAFGLCSGCAPPNLLLARCAGPRSASAASPDVHGRCRQPGGAPVRVRGGGDRGPGRLHVRIPGVCGTADGAVCEPGRGCCAAPAAVRLRSRAGASGATSSHAALLSEPLVLAPSRLVPAAQSLLACSTFSLPR